MKRVIASVAVSSGLCGLVRRSRRGATLVLAYHNVVPHGEAVGGDPGLHLPQREFAEHLDLLRAYYDVVPLADLHRESGSSGIPRAVVTFDDAYRGALTVGVEELVKRGLPATVFAPAGLLGGRSFWWDELAGRRGHLHPAVRDYLLSELEGRQERVLRWAKRQGRRLGRLPAHASTVTQEELAVVSGRPGITVASHSWSHPNLAALAHEELVLELSRSRDLLRSIAGDAFVPWLAYPYGIGGSAPERAARATGHDGAVLVNGGLASRDPSSREDPFRTPRVNVPAGMTRDEFLLRATGVLEREDGLRL